ncbi:hypothetical protein LCGC14_1723570, partial [marine sediment metagenome]
LLLLLLIFVFIIEVIEETANGLVEYVPFWSRSASP